ncbi:hypothetical protein [Dyadobacter fermentans]|uniref:Uncharacterized protein n=1 Tax=Dyadobacter fermentans (strain ATCC 700827 / DSM 18053 / CIP 107007 / KCTC 52180 / NS114) TaxID=471854 RepID=C6W140_DYAFD|nr:hypothetical protein [Dyadobacter fermentans]ACT95495.1 hypothetical protein Dfer_4293 [Dyadobacter fermentans DSM 18053]
MDTLQNFQSPEKSESPSSIDATEPSSPLQQIIKDFFQKDSGPEMIESLNTLIETYLFTENLTRVTPEMREHIVNQLRVATLIAKLGASNEAVVRHSPPH